MKKRKIVGLGESVYDIIFSEGQPKSAVPGGSTFNAMVSLGRTTAVKHPEVDCVMISQMGDDMVADIFEAFMKDNNLSTEALAHKEGTKSTVSLAFLDKNSNASYEFLGDRDVNPELLPELEFNAGDLVIFGSFFAVNKNLRGYRRKMMKAAREAGAIIYYDINFRKNHLSVLEQIRPDIIENCRMSDFVRGSDEDIFHVFGSNDPQKVYSEQLSKLCPNYICTKGGNPVEVFSPGVRAQFEVPRVKPVSTVGAGDNFNAGFVYGLLDRKMDKVAVDSMTEESWAILVNTATRFSSAVCESMFNYVDKDFADKKL